jgi:hypothetical protein
MPDQEPVDLVHQDPSKPELVTKPDAAKELAVMMDQINTLQKAVQKREAELGVGITDEEKLRQEDNMTAAIIIAEKYPHAVVGGKVQIVGDSGPFIVIKPDDGGRSRIIGRGGVSRFDRNNILFLDAANANKELKIENADNFFNRPEVLDTLMEPFSKVATGIDTEIGNSYDFTKVGNEKLKLGNGVQEVTIGIPVRGANFDHRTSARNEASEIGMLQKPFLAHMEEKYKSDPLPTDAKAPLPPIADLF